MNQKKLRWIIVCLLALVISSLALMLVIPRMIAIGEIVVPDYQLIYTINSFVFFTFCYLLAISLAISWLEHAGKIVFVNTEEKTQYREIDNGDLDYLTGEHGDLLIITELLFSRDETKEDSLKLIDRIYSSGEWFIKKIAKFHTTGIPFNHGDAKETGEQEEKPVTSPYGDFLLTDDEIAVIDDIVATAREIAILKGWNVYKNNEWKDDYKIPGILALIHSEVSEALESFRANDRMNFFEELADIVIRVFDLAGGFTSYSFGKMIASKFKKNFDREYKHGGKRV